MQLLDLVADRKRELRERLRQQVRRRRGKKESTASGQALRRRRPQQRYRSVASCEAGWTRSSMLVLSAFFKVEAQGLGCRVVSSFLCLI